MGCDSCLSVLAISLVRFGGRSSHSVYCQNYVVTGEKRPIAAVHQIRKTPPKQGFAWAHCRYLCQTLRQSGSPSPLHHKPRRPVSLRLRAQFTQLASSYTSDSQCSPKRPRTPRPPLVLLRCLRQLSLRSKYPDPDRSRHTGKFRCFRQRCLLRYC